MEINFGTNINTNSYALDDIILLADLITPVGLCESENFKRAYSKHTKEFSSKAKLKLLFSRIKQVRDVF